MKRIHIASCCLSFSILVVLNTLCFGKTAEGADSIKVVTEEFPPFNYTSSKTGALTGFSTGIVQALLDELNVNADIQSFPWARAYKMAQTQKNVLIFSLKRTEKRDALFKWVGALIQHEAFFLARKEDNIKPATALNTIKQYRIGAIRDGAIAKGLEDDGFSRIYLSADRHIIWELLKRNGVDLWCTNILSARHIITSMGDDPDSVKIIHRYERLSKDSLYMAFSIQTDDALVERFRSGYKRLKRKDVYQNILKRYGVFRKIE